MASFRFKVRLELVIKLPSDNSIVDLIMFNSQSDDELLIRFLALISASAIVRLPASRVSFPNDTSPAQLQFPPLMVRSIEVNSLFKKLIFPSDEEDSDIVPSPFA